MKIIVATLVLMALTACASPETRGTLVYTERGASVTGKFLYICAYSVAGKKNEIMLDKPCPRFFKFD